MSNTALTQEKQGFFVVGDYLKLTQATDKDTGEVKHYVNVLVDFGEGQKVETVKVKTSQPKKWATVSKSMTVKIPVSIFTPKDSSLLYFSEIV